MPQKPSQNAAYPKTRTSNLKISRLASERIRLDWAVAGLETAESQVLRSDRAAVRQLVATMLSESTTRGHAQRCPGRSCSPSPSLPGFRCLLTRGRGNSIRQARFTLPNSAKLYVSHWLTICLASAARSLSWSANPRDRTSGHSLPGESVQEFYEKQL